MKRTLTLLFFIKILFLSEFNGYAQKKEIKINDTITKNNKYGLRIGVDIARPVISLFDENFSGFEGCIDLRELSKEKCHIVTVRLVNGQEYYEIINDVNLCLN